MDRYHPFTPGRTAPGALVVKLYPTGGTVRGYVRKIAACPDDDAIFPGEQMEPQAAFTLARAHAEGAPVFVELASDVIWDPEWGTLED